MMMILFLMFFVGADSSLLQQSRQLYFQFEQEACPAEKLFALISEDSAKQDARLMAYKGTARATSASCVLSPFAKLSRFKEGKSLIEKSVETDSNNVEIRFLRLSVQLNAPDFLNYSDMINADRALIVQRLAEDPNCFSDIEFTGKVLNYLLIESNPTPREREKLLTLQRTNL